MDFVEELNKRIRGRSDLEVARLCKVSLPTVDRWKRGVSSPHSLGQESVMTALDRDVIKITLRKAS